MDRAPQSCLQLDLASDRGDLSAHKPACARQSSSASGVFVALSVPATLSRQRQQTNGGEPQAPKARNMLARGKCERSEARRPWIDASKAASALKVRNRNPLNTRAMSLLQ